MKQSDSNTCFQFIGIPKKKQKQLLDVLKVCKEIRNTAYPLKGSKKTDLIIKTCTAVKEKDMVSLTGSLFLEDGKDQENRVFEAYMMENKEEIRIFLDITRLCVADEPKLIRTSETILEKENSIFAITKYNCIENAEEKIYMEEIYKLDKKEKNVQLSAI